MVAQFSQLFKAEKAVGGKGRIKILATQCQPLRLFEIKAVTEADLDFGILAQQKGRLVAVIVHNSDFSVFAQRLRDDADTSALHDFIFLFADGPIKRVCPAKARGRAVRHKRIIRVVSGIFSRKTGKPAPTARMPASIALRSLKSPPNKVEPSMKFGGI